MSAPVKRAYVKRAPAKPDELTPQQEMLVNSLLRGDGIEDAKKAAGYSATATFYGSLASFAVQRAIASRLEKSIAMEGASLAYIAMIALTKEGTVPSVRFQASKWLLEAAGLGAKADSDSKADKQIHEMTNDELEAFLARTESIIEAGGSAPIITVKPDSGA